MDGKATRKTQESNLQTMIGIKTQTKAHSTSHATEGLRKIGAIAALIMI
jgi:hypothetical protein